MFVYCIQPLITKSNIVIGSCRPSMKCATVDSHKSGKSVAPHIFLMSGSLIVAFGMFKIGVLTFVVSIWLITDFNISPYFDFSSVTPSDVSAAPEDDEVEGGGADTDGVFDD